MHVQEFGSFHIYLFIYLFIKKGFFWLFVTEYRISALEMVSCCHWEDGFPYASVTPLCANAAA